MTNVQSLFRSLIVYALCIPLAIFLGYQLSDPLNRGSFVTTVLVLLLLCAPLLIRFHFPLMLLSWNLGAILFFLPGSPQLSFATITLSYALSFTHRILNREVKPISVPTLTWPIIAIAAVVLVTGMMTGGIGVRAFGGNVYGGRRYFYIFLAIVGYFALTAQRIPRERAFRCVGLFFLGGLAYALGDFFPVLGSGFDFLFWVFPPSNLTGDFQFGITRFGGLGLASSAIFAYMMARYGLRGIFDASRPWRLMAFVLFSAMGTLGGFRSVILNYAIVFTLQFFLEGLHRTKLLLTMGLATCLVVVPTLALATKLPPTVQRALAFLPIPIDPIVRQDADESSQWRLRMWKAVLPQVPQYLLLGKGLGMTSKDYSHAVQHGSLGAFEEQWEASLAGDYHNGPLSVVIPFGIWGLIAWTWFLAAGLWVLYRNYRYGDESLRTINTFLLAAFLGRMLMFWFVVGGFYLDFMYYIGLLGLNVSLNGGVARPVPSSVEESPQIRSFAAVAPRHQPVFRRPGN